MFNFSDLSLIDYRYFQVISTTCMHVTLKSPDTGHEWFIASYEGKDWTSCAIYHRHHHCDSWHSQCHRPTLLLAQQYIKNHDAWFVLRSTK